MRILFCSDPMNRREVDADYREEYECARNVGFKVDLINLEELIEGNPMGAVQSIPMADNVERAIYRGWMMKPMHYELLYECLKRNNIILITNTLAYRHCHHLPESYSVIKEYTPCTVWLYEENLNDSIELEQALQCFGQSPILIKDFVKSQKHHWHEACFAPDASDLNHVQRVMGKFLELQGSELNEGIVFRAYVKLAHLTDHSISGMPLSKEYRVFYFEGQPIFLVNYWDEGEYDETAPQLSAFNHVAEQVKSPFFTMDLAQTDSGDWIIVELGDAQVSGLPDHADIENFYTQLKRFFSAHS